MKANVLIETKNGKPVSHRYNRLPLLASAPGGVQQELVVLICRDKDTGFFRLHQVRERKFLYHRAEWIHFGKLEGET